MDARVALGAAGALTLAILAGAGFAQPSDVPPPPDAPVPTGPPPASTQLPPPPETTPPETAPPITVIPPPPEVPALSNASPAAPGPTDGKAKAPTEAKVAPPPGPPKPVRGPVAVLRVLDKVTAETLRFEAPVGRRVRYKTLIFTVKVCETRGLEDPLPRPSAYVVIDSQPPALPGRAAPAAKEVYKGWMFANGPGLHPFEHPVYDAWLVTCGGAVAPT